METFEKLLSFGSQSYTEYTYYAKCKVAKAYDYNNVTYIQNRGVNKFTFHHVILLYMYFMNGVIQTMEPTTFPVLLRLCYTFLHYNPRNRILGGSFLCY